MVHCQLDRNQIKLADSLFKANRLLDAERIYKKNRFPNSAEEENISFKLAYIAKAKNDWVNELYYLSSIHARQNSNVIAQRLEEIGIKHQVSGYERSLSDQIAWLYFFLFPYIMGVLILLGMYAAIILLNKYRKKRRVRRPQLAFISIYLLLLFAFCNFPSLLQFGIVTKDKTYVRASASSAAPVINQLKKGNRINYWINQDIWVTCLFNGKIGYIKSNDFRPIY